MATRLSAAIALGALFLCQAASAAGPQSPVLQAGLAAFEAHHALAPAVKRLAFRRIPSRKQGEPQPLAARVLGDRGFNLALPSDASGRRYHVTPDIRTPGLAPNQRRLGDLRLECKVTAAMARADMPAVVVTVIDSVMTRDWCGYFNEKQNARLGYEAERPLRSALLREAKWTLDLKPAGASFEVPVGSPHWSDAAIIELTYAERPTGTAGGRPRTGP